MFQTLAQVDWFAPGNSASELKGSPRDAVSALAFHLKSGTSSFLQLKLFGVQVAASEGAAAKGVGRDSSQEKGSSSFLTLPCCFPAGPVHRGRERLGKGRSCHSGRWHLSGARGLPCQACPGRCKPSRSARPPGTTLKVYVEALTGRSHVYRPDVSPAHYSLQAVSWGKATAPAVPRRTEVCSEDRGEGEGPPTAWVQLTGPPALKSSRRLLPSSSNLPSLRALINQELGSWGSYWENVLLILCFII